MGTNMLAPPAYNGTTQSPFQRAVDITFDYVYDVVMTANQVLNDQVVPIQNDADFIWRAFRIGTATGAFKIRFSDSQGYYFSNSLINSANFQSGGVNVDYAIFPEVAFPSGGRIGIDITDLSGAGNTIELLFRGIKRYRMPGSR